MEICHWNIDNIFAHNFIKSFLLWPYITIQKFDVVYLSETYLNASISNDDNRFQIPSFNLFRVDHPSKTKRWTAYIYYRNVLSLKILGIPYLQECISFEIIIGGELCKFVSLYHPLNQLQDDFESFANNFELDIDAVTAINTFLTTVLGDFNIKSNLWLIKMRHQEGF